MEPTQKRCAYVSMDPFLHDTAVVSAHNSVRSRALFEPSQVAPVAPSTVFLQHRPSRLSLRNLLEPPSFIQASGCSHPSRASLSDSVDKRIPKPCAFHNRIPFVIAVGISTHP